MLPMPTNARSWFVAYLRSGGASEEEIEESIDALAEEEGTFLMLTGGAAGVCALTDAINGDFILSFGECHLVNAISVIAYEVYGFKKIKQGELC